MKKLVIFAIVVFGALFYYAPVTIAAFSPVITELSPASGKAGDTIEIRGRYFIGDEHPDGRHVYVSSSKGLKTPSLTAEVVYWGGELVTFKFPLGVTPGATYYVSVSRSGRLADQSNSVEFTVDPLPVPSTLTGISTNTGTKGDLVRFYGTGLSGAYSIFMFSPDQARCSGGETFSPEGTTDTEISFRVPEMIPHCDYLFYVWVARPDWSGVLVWAKLFRYLAPPQPIPYRFGIGLPFVSK